MKNAEVHAQTLTEENARLREKLERYENEYGMIYDVGEEEEEGEEGEEEDDHMDGLQVGSIEDREEVPVALNDTDEPEGHGGDGPENDDGEVTNWIKEHTLDENELNSIQDWLHSNGNPVLKLAHGATVYDVGGQNICLTDCLTTNETDDNMRQIIFFPDGSIAYDWCYAGAILL